MTDSREAQGQSAASTSTPKPPPPTKPRMRGVFHHYSAVASAAGGALLTLDAPDAFSRLGCVVYTLSITAMFAISATYHRPNWGPRARQIMRRLDHSAIYLLIAGTYTPLCMIALDPGVGGALLRRVWLGAAAGVLNSLLMPESRSSKAVSTCLYLGLGWTALPYAWQLRTAMPPSSTALVVAGGVMYSVGAAVYAFKWPNPHPHVYGYHEIFHLFVCAAALLHFVAVRGVVRRKAGFA